MEECIIAFFSQVYLQWMMLRCSFFQELSFEVSCKLLPHAVIKETIGSAGERPGFALVVGDGGPCPLHF